jgi:hypothetical protein
MPRHYRKPSDKKIVIQTYEKEIIDINKPKKIKENNIFDYSSDKKDKVNNKKKINKKK